MDKNPRGKPVRACIYCLECSLGFNTPRVARAAALFVVAGSLASSLVADNP